MAKIMKQMPANHKSMSKSEHDKAMKNMNSSDKKTKKKY